MSDRYIIFLWYGMRCMRSRCSFGSKGGSGCSFNVGYNNGICTI
jgi:hypothetical protein